MGKGWQVGVRRSGMKFREGEVGWNVVRAKAVVGMHANAMQAFVLAEYCRRRVGRGDVEGGEDDAGKRSRPADGGVEHAASKERCGEVNDDVRQRLALRLVNGHGEGEDDGELVAGHMQLEVRVWEGGVGGVDEDSEAITVRNALRGASSNACVVEVDIDSVQVGSRGFDELWSVRCGPGASPGSVSIGLEVLWPPDPLEGDDDTSCAVVQAGRDVDVSAQHNLAADAELNGGGQAASVVAVHSAKGSKEAATGVGVHACLRLVVRCKLDDLQTSRVRKLSHARVVVASDGGLGGEEAGRVQKVRRGEEVEEVAAAVSVWVHTGQKAARAKHVPVKGGGCVCAESGQQLSKGVVAALTVGHLEGDGVEEATVQVVGGGDEEWRVTDEDGAALNRGQLREVTDKKHCHAAEVSGGAEQLLQALVHSVEGFGAAHADLVNDEEDEVVVGSSEALLADCRQCGHAAANVLVDGQREGGVHGGATDVVRCYARWSCNDDTAARARSNGAVAQGPVSDELDDGASHV